MELEVSRTVKSVIMACHQFKNSGTSSNLAYLTRQLEILHSLSGRSQASKFFSPRELLTLECLSCLVELLKDPQIKPTLAIKCAAVLGSLAQDGELRDLMYNNYQLTPVLAALTTGQGLAADSLALECLQLMQKLTYGQRVSFHESFTEPLICFLVHHIIEKTSEVIEPCLGLLANLCRDNHTVQSFVKNMDNVKRLYRSLCTFFADNNLAVVIFALSCFTSLCLHEDLGQKIFRSENINQTLQLMFNVLVNGESITARRYAVDLFQDLLKNPKIQHSLQVYQHLPSCLSHTLSLLCSSAPQATAKVFELLIAFCTVDSIQSWLCHSLLSAKPPAMIATPEDLLSHSTSSLTDPLMATLHWAAQPVTHGNSTSLLALDFLTEVYEELVYGESSEDLRAHAGLCLPVLVRVLTAPVDGEDRLAHAHCLKLVKVLKLLKVLCADDHTRPQVVQAVHTGLVSGLVSAQLQSHQPLASLASSHSSRNALHDCSSAGVEVVLCAMELAAGLRRLVSGLEEWFTATLQESQLVPFLAAAVTSGDKGQVAAAYSLIAAGSQLEFFPMVELGDATATMLTQRLSRERAAASTSDSAKPLPPSLSLPALLPRRQGLAPSTDKENIPASISISKQENSVAMETDSSIHHLIEKMQGTLDMKDASASDIIEIYAHKVKTLQTRCEHLQDLLEAKALALTQADRLLSQYRTNQARHEAEVHKLQCLFRDTERKSQQLGEEVADLRLFRERLQRELDVATMENQRLNVKAEELEELKNAHSELNEKHEATERSLQTLRQEHRTTSEMLEMHQKHYESLKHSMTSTEQLNCLEEERKSLSRTLKEKEGRLQDTSKALTKLEAAHKLQEKERDELERENEQLEKAIEKLQHEISITEQHRNELQQKVSALETACQQGEAVLRKHEVTIAQQNEEIQKHAEIAKLIHSLSGGSKEVKK